MERKIGETFEYEGKTFRVKENENYGCHSCFFYKRCTLSVIKMAGQCDPDCREDNKDVVFVEVQEQPQKTEEIKERKVGEVFDFEGHKLKVVDEGTCKCNECLFYRRECSSIRNVTGSCSEVHRTDKKSVIFVEVKDEQPQKLNLCEVLKYCPKDEQFWSPMLDGVKFSCIDEELQMIIVETVEGHFTWEINADGTISIDEVTSPEIMLFPSRTQRDWTKVKYEPKKERFDPKTLKPFDKIIFKGHGMWFCGLFSHIHNSYACIGETYYKCVIPYNDDTKHLVGTKDEAPVFYRYWED